MIVSAAAQMVGRFLCGSAVVKLERHPKMQMTDRLTSRISHGIQRTLSEFL